MQAMCVTGGQSIMGKFVKRLIMALTGESQHLGLVNNVRGLLVIQLFYPRYAIRIDTPILF